MAKRLKYFNEVQIMRNGMEQVKTTNGSVKVLPKEVTAGGQGTLTITYTVGEEPIYIGGVLRFTIPFGFTKPQISMPIFPGYTTVRTTRANASVKTFLVENDWWKRGPDRTKPENVSEHVGTHVFVRISGHALTRGDEVILTYGDTAYQAQAAACFCRTSGPVQFDVATDWKGTLEAPYSGYYLTSNPPTMMVHPKEAAFFEVILPSDLQTGMEAELTVLAVDPYHNLSVNHRGTLSCIVVRTALEGTDIWNENINNKDINHQLIYEGEFEEDDCGIKKIRFMPENPGILRVRAADSTGELAGQSNPGVCTGLVGKKSASALNSAFIPNSDAATDFPGATNSDATTPAPDRLSHAASPGSSHTREKLRHFWGDLHGHTGIQWGRGSGRSYYEYAREAAALDFCALTDPDAGRYTNNNETAHLSLSCYMTDQQWKEIQEVNKAFYEEGHFVPILGYEYHNDAPNPEFGGDRNVYYDSYDEPIRRCVDQGSYCPEQLWNQLKEQKIRAITVPHHTAKKVMLGSWEIHDEEFQRLVEIYSCWGNSEGEGCERPIIGGSLYENHSVQYALNKGFRLGFVTGSDTHAGTPGYSHWVFSAELESYRGGLTCVMAKSLDRHSIFEALWNRSVYATTGERILLEFSVNGVPMGQELPLSENRVRTLHVRVIGTGEIETVEIISMGHTVHRREGNGNALEFDWSDSTQPEDGWLYYYVRVYQKNKAIAWSSPIWVS